MFKGARASGRRVTKAGVFFICDPYALILPLDTLIIRTPYKTETLLKETTNPYKRRSLQRGLGELSSPRVRQVFRHADGTKNVRPHWAPFWGLGFRV